VEHGVAPFFLPKLVLPVEALDGHERVLYQRLYGDPEMAILLAKLEGNFFEDLWELPQDFQRNVPVGSGGNPCLRDYSIWGNKSKAQVRGKKVIRFFFNLWSEF